MFKSIATSIEQLQQQNKMLSQYFNTNETQNTSTNYIIQQTQYLVSFQHYLFIIYYILFFIFMYVLFTGKIGKTYNMYMQGSILGIAVILPYIIWPFEFFIYSKIMYLFSYFNVTNLNN